METKTIKQTIKEELKNIFVNCDDIIVQTFIKEEKKLISFHVIKKDVWRPIVKNLPTYNTISLFYKSEEDVNNRLDKINKDVFTIYQDYKNNYDAVQAIFTKYNNLK